MATKQVYTPDVPAITAHSKFENLLVPGHSACVFVLPNFLCACPACGLISNTASGLEAHIKGKKDRSCCVEYSWKFGPWAKLELGKKEPSAKNTHPTPYPNIKWKTGNLGKNVTADELEESNAFNKKWLEDRNFPTSNSKRNIDAQPASKPAFFFSEENLAKLSEEKDKDPAYFELTSSAWHPVNKQQFNEYVQRKKEQYTDELKVADPELYALARGSTNLEGEVQQDDDGNDTDLDLLEKSVHDDDETVRNEDETLLKISDDAAALLAVGGKPSTPKSTKQKKKKRVLGTARGGKGTGRKQRNINSLYQR